MVDPLSYIPDPESESNPEHKPADKEEVFLFARELMLETGWESMTPQPNEEIPVASPLIPASMLEDNPLVIPAEKSKKSAKINVRQLIFVSISVLLIVWLLQNCHRDIPLAQLKERYTFPDSRFISVNGMEVHVRISGKGEPILLLHDAYSSLHTWANWTKKLAQHYQVISVDLPGFGLTGPAPGSQYDALLYTNFLDSLINTLGLKKLTLVGNGLGAKIGWMYAKEPNNKLNKLLLLNAPGFEKNESNAWFSVITDIPILYTLVRYITPKSYIHSQLEKRFSHNDAVSDSLVQRHFDLLLRSGNRNAVLDRARSNEKWPPAISNITQINVPVLIIWGADDQCIVPKNAYLFHQKMPQAVMKIYPDTGHWPQEENPEKTIADVMKFLEGKF